jgi:hypothetical protein
MQTFLHDLNELIGLFLIIIAFGIGSCVKSLAEIKDELVCLHEDFEAIHQAHTIKEAQARSKYGI